MICDYSLSKKISLKKKQRERETFIAVICDYSLSTCRRRVLVKIEIIQKHRRVRVSFCSDDRTNLFLSLRGTLSCSEKSEGIYIRGGEEGGTHKGKGEAT